MQNEILKIENRIAKLKQDEMVNQNLNKKWQRKLNKIKNNA